MATRKLTPSQWQTYFDQVSQELGGRNAEIHIAGLRLGDQVEAEYVPLQGLAYDPKDDLFEVVTDDVDHLINHPKEIYVDEGADGLHSVAIIDSDGNHQIIQLRVPVLLAEG